MIRYITRNWCMHTDEARCEIFLGTFQHSVLEVLNCYLVSLQNEDAMFVWRDMQYDRMTHSRVVNEGRVDFDIFIKMFNNALSFEHGRIKLERMTTLKRSIFEDALQCALKGVERIIGNFVRAAAYHSILTQHGIVCLKSAMRLGLHVEVKCILIYYNMLCNLEVERRFLNVKARVIQRRFRQVITNPHNVLCQRRLAREFSEFNHRFTK